jgi:CHASE2 domain-containing sensor protein
LRYGSYIPQEQWEREGLVSSAAEIRSADSHERRRRLAHKIVIVGGGWHSRAIGRGPLIDSFPTPAGKLAGAMVHANYIEALLDGRVYRQLSAPLAIGVEVSTIVVASVTFAMDIAPVLKSVLVAAFGLILLAFNYVALQNLGQFFDGFVPIVLVFGHSIVDQVLGWRRDALQHRASRRQHESRGL